MFDQRLELSKNIVYKNYIYLYIHVYYISLYILNKSSWFEWLQCNSGFST